MKQPFVPPQFEETAFNCPFCNAYADQKWETIRIKGFQIRASYENDMRLCHCSHCKNYSIWQKKKMVYPDFLTTEPPNEDLDKQVKDDYREAAEIVQKSPRGAAALLRLALQKLCIQLGEKGKNINNNIKNLVKKGLPVKVQEALDSVRVIGNESVHPGTLDIRDDISTALALFQLVNFIAEKMITEPKEIQAIYEKIPETKKEQIKERDGSKE